MDVTWSRWNHSIMRYDVKNKKCISIIICRFNPSSGQGADALASAHDYAVTMMLYIVYLCYAVAGIVVIVSALQIYIKMNTGEEGVKKNIMMLVGACLFLIGATIVFPAFFGYQI